MSLKNVGYHPHRFKSNPRERIFSDVWRDMLEKAPNAYDVLSYILNVDGERNPATDHDRKVAATVIQWLGSPVGQGFLERVNKAMEAANV